MTFYHHGRISMTSNPFWQQFERVMCQSPNRREREKERELQRAGDPRVVTFIVSERCRRKVLRRLGRKLRKELREHKN